MKVKYVRVVEIFREPNMSLAWNNRLQKDAMLLFEKHVQLGQQNVMNAPKNDFLFIINVNDVVIFDVHYF